MDNNAIEYYLGNKAYNLFLQGIIFRNYDYSSYILDKKYINASKVGFISNIFLAIKESLVDKTNEGYVSRVLISILEDNVSLIANKKENGYMIDNYLFKDAPTLVSKLRNKIAHGMFYFDLEHNRIILDIENNLVRINIDKLSLFVVSSLKTYIKGNYSSNRYERNMIIINKVNNNRNKPITSKGELKGLINNSFNINIKLKRKDNENIDNYIINKLNNVINNYNITNDISILYRFCVSLGNDYEFTYDTESFKNKDMDDFISFILNIMPSDIDYNKEVLFIGSELDRYNNKNNKYLSLLTDNLNNIILLDSVRKNNTTDLSIVFKDIMNNYDKFYISYSTLVSSSLSMFTSLFSYNIDNIFKNDNKHTLFPNTGFDYSKLDLSLMEVSVNDFNNNVINELKTRELSLTNRINEIDNKIKNNTNSLNAVIIKKDNLAMNKISGNLGILNNQKNLLLNEYNLVVNKLGSYLNNPKYLENDGIINGIRNSISHGNYEIIPNIDIINTMIVFKDIDNDIITFQGKISILDFISLIDNNANIINNYINNKVKVKK